MGRHIPEGHPLCLLFKQATNWAFRHGWFLTTPARDVRLKEYLAEDLLLRFLYADELYRLRDARGRPLADVGEMLTEGEAGGVSPDLHALTVQRHIGDYTLFITGVFPESLDRLRRDWRRKDSVMLQLGDLVVPFRDPGEYYEEAGRRAYRHAAEMGSAVGLTEADVYAKLSEHFRLFVQLLSLVRMYLDASPLFIEQRRLII